MMSHNNSDPSRRSLQRAAALAMSLAALGSAAPAGAADPASPSAGRLLAQAAAAPEWREGVTYTAGTHVVYNGTEYVALVTHTAWVGAGWTPVAAPALWAAVGSAPAPAPTPTPTPPPPPPAPVPGPPPGGDLTLPEAVRAAQNRRTYTGYYPTWSDNWFDATGKTANDVYRASKFARIPGTYTHVMAAFARPDFAWHGLTANSFAGTGLDFTATPRDIKAAIDVLHQRNMKVILAVGGATYNNWGTLAAEGQRGSGPTIDALANILRDLGFDGLDVDYEVGGNVDEYANSTRALRLAVDRAGGGRILSLAGWSTGADCTGATTGDPRCAGKLSFWGGNAGRERALALRYPAVAAGLDMVNVMSYDARFENFDGATAYAAYREVFGPRTIVSIGFESPPEGWAGGILVINNADAQCEGSRNLKNQYGATLNQPYSVQRYLGAVTGNTVNANPRDGAMLWSILKTASGNCGSAAVASPGTIGQKVGNTFGLPVDPALQLPEWR
jgi:hypothetical protein